MVWVLSSSGAVTEVPSGFGGPALAGVDAPCRWSSGVWAGPGTPFNLSTFLKKILTHWSA